MHEHVAPLWQNLPPSNNYDYADLHGPSPHLNHPDGVWNHGEGFPLSGATDTGGIFAFDDGTNLVIGDVRITSPNATWESHTVTYPGVPQTSMHRLRGHLYLRNQTGPIEIEAAFDLFAPLTYNATPLTSTVLVVSVWATMPDPPPDQGGMHTYPGWMSVGTGENDGLVRYAAGVVSRPVPWSDWLVAWSNTSATDQLNVIAGYIVPRTAGRNLASAMQRALQLEKAMHLILQSASATVRPPSFPSGAGQFPVVASGSSFGGLTSQMLPLFFPRRFHGAVAYSFGGSLRRTVADQETYTMMAALCGFADSGTAYGDRDRLEWSTPLHQSELGSSFFDASFVERLHTSPKVYRPTYFLLSDEDTVTQGTEWASLLDGVRAYNGAGFKENVDGDVFWSRLDKACHDSYWFRFPDQLGADPALTGPKGVDSLLKAPLPFLKIAKASFDNVIGPSTPGHLGPPDASQDTFDHVLARGTVPARNAAKNPSPPPLLAVDSTFVSRTAPLTTSHHQGLGTWLGHRDAMVGHVDGSARHVYVGSADGVVSKLALDPPTKELVTIAQSSSLGYAAQGLTVGQLGTAEEVFVATYRALHRLHKDTLATIESRALPWDYTRPQHLTIAALGTGSTRYLLFHTQHGYLVVMDASLDVVVDWYEPGIADLVVDPVNGPLLPGWSRPIFLQSERGRVVKVALNLQGGTDRCRVLGATEPLAGKPGGLRYDPTSGKLAALYYDATALLEAGQIGFNVHEISTALGPGGDNMKIMASKFVGYDADGGYGDRGIADLENLGGDWVVQVGGSLYRVPIGGTHQRRELWRFAPATWPCDVAIFDLDGGGDEIVLGTQAGLVVWLPGSSLSTGTLPTFDPQKPHEYTSGSVVATWGMTYDGTDLHVVDQAARHWRVDALTGAAQCVELFTGYPTVPQSPLILPLPKPFRDLVRLQQTVVTFLSADPVSTQPLTGSHRHLVANPFYPHVSGDPLTILPPDWGNPSWSASLSVQSQLFADCYVPCSLGGAEQAVGAKQYIHWWSANTPAFYQNLLQGGVLDSGTFTHQGSSSDGNALHLRNISTTASHSHQALRLGRWSAFGETAPRIVVATTGGGVIVVDPTVTPDGRIIAELAPHAGGDLGYGGMALAVCDPNVASRPVGNPLIFVATLETHAGSATNRRDMVSSLQILERLPPPEGGPALGVWERHRYVFDGHPANPGQPKLWGICGIAIGDVDLFAGSGDGDADDEIVLTTLNGDLVVYDLVHDGSGAVQLGALLHWDILPGSLGACNSILIRDFDSDGKNEVYVAGSGGIRKLVQV